jgi:phosphatidylserine/phosphatidylglycerophosphate/cardiolipin synthase-like enzyme
VALALVAALGVVRAADAAETTQAQVTACFTPQDDCASLLQQSIEMARTRIRVLAYELTDRSVINALIGAKRRGVDVQAVLDRVNQRGLNGREGSATILAAAGIPVWIDRPAGIEHNKTMVIDDDLVIGGSYNFTYSAQHRNAENMTLTRSPIVARWYLDYWAARMALSETIAPATE